MKIRDPEGHLKPHFVVSLVIGLGAVAIAVLVAWNVGPYPEDGIPVYIGLAFIVFLGLAHAYAEERREQEEASLEEGSKALDETVESRLVLFRRFNRILVIFAVGLYGFVGFPDPSHNDEGAHLRVGVVALIGAVLALAQLAIVARYGWRAFNAKNGLLGTCVGLILFLILAAIYLPLGLSN